MSDQADAPNVVIHPPIALAIALVLAFALNWFWPQPFVPPAIPHIQLGVLLVIGMLLIIRWAAVTFRKARTNILTSQAATTIVATGPFAFSRNPIYVAALIGMAGATIAFDSLWFIAALVVIWIVLRYGVIAREESYLERKFGAPYLDYKSKVRRWL
jgi:protein-S-isoprenylcysteine O-methyltransferase Ste14